VSNPKLFMAQPCGSQLWHPFVFAVRNLWMMDLPTTLAEPLATWLPRCARAPGYLLSRKPGAAFGSVSYW